MRQHNITLFIIYNEHNPYFYTAITVNHKLLINYAARIFQKTVTVPKSIFILSPCRQGPALPLYLLPLHYIDGMANSIYVLATKRLKIVYRASQGQRNILLELQGLRLRCGRNKGLRGANSIYILRSVNYGWQNMEVDIAHITGTNIVIA